METSDDLSKFRDALRNWAEAVFEQASRTAVRQQSIRKWRRVARGKYQLAARKERTIDDEIYLRAFHISGWNRVEDAAYRSVLRPFFSDSIGTTAWRSTIHLRDFALRTLDATLAVPIDGGVRFDHEAFNVRVDAFDEIVLSPSVSEEIIVLLDRVGGLTGGIKLDESAILRELSDAELDSIIPLMIIPPRPSNEDGQTWEIVLAPFERTALVRTIKSDKVIGSPSPPLPYQTPAIVDADIRCLLDSLSIATGLRAAALGWLARPENRVLQSVTLSRHLAVPQPEDYANPIADVSNADAVRDSWLALRNEDWPNSVEQNRFAIAARNFGLATSAVALPERLLHAIISLEALLIPHDVPSVATSLPSRVAAWCADELPQWTASSIVSVIRTAYDYRNGIVHGRHIDFSRKAEVGGMRVMLDEIVDSTVSIAQASIQKAAQTIVRTGTLKIDWDELAASAGDPREILLRSKRWYEEHRSELTEKYSGCYVAILRNRVVDADKNFTALANRMRDKFGASPVFMPLVTASQPSVT